MLGSAPLRYEVREAHDLYVPRRAVRDLCGSLGFSRKDCHEVAIVVSELTSNILKYGIRGSVEFREIEDARFGLGLLVVAQDIGPPFRDLELALRDGYDDRGPIDPVTLLKRGGLGAGLGAVLRLMDSFEVRVVTPTGKEIHVVRWRNRPRQKSR